MTRAVEETKHVDELRLLEAEAVHIIREVVAELERPVLLFSAGKDSIVLLRLAEKAFRPLPLPFPVMHVDTGHNFPEVIEFRDRRVSDNGHKLIVASVQESIDKGRVPDPGRRASRNRAQTRTLLDALEAGEFDAAFGGARRDEEKSRAKERVFSFRSVGHVWDPRNQRPELWNLYNTRIAKGETIRVFPLSNWTELDIWQYTRAEDIPVVPLYFAAPRPVVKRDGLLIMRDDDRMPLLPGEVEEARQVRFRSLGCYPLSAAIESDAQSLDDIIAEMMATRTSERSGRLIDNDEAASMERKKREGYF